MFPHLQVRLPGDDNRQLQNTAGNAVGLRNKIGDNLPPGTVIRKIGTPSARSYAERTRAAISSSQCVIWLHGHTYGETKTPTIAASISTARPEEGLLKK